MSTLNNISITIALATDSGYQSSEHLYGTDPKTSGEAAISASPELHRIAGIAGVDLSPTWKRPDDRP